MRWFGLEVEGVPNWERQNRINFAVVCFLAFLLVVNLWMAHRNYIYNMVLEGEYARSQEEYREYIRLHKEKDRMEFVKDSLEVEKLKRR